MALTYTPRMSEATVMPHFRLPTVGGQHFDSADIKTISVVAFICNHCPYVQAIEDRLLILARKHSNSNSNCKVQWVGICSNDSTDHPEDSPAQLLARWKDKNYGFPYLLDTDQSVAKAFGAVCTPDLFVFDAEKKLRYRGRFDDSWRNPAKVTRQDLSLAIDSILSGHEPQSPQVASMGCSIKWRDL